MRASSPLCVLMMPGLRERDRALRRRLLFTAATRRPSLQPPPQTSNTNMNTHGGFKLEGPVSVNGNQSSSPLPPIWKETKGILSSTSGKKNIQTLEKTFTCLSKSSKAFRKKKFRTDGKSKSKIFSGGEKPPSYEPKRQTEEIKLFLSVQPCQQHFKVTEEEEPSSTPLHLPQQEVQCANHPPPALSDRTPSHVTHLTCLRHTMQMSNLRLDNHTLFSLRTVQAITTLNISR